MELIITLRKEVADEAEADTLYNIVKAKLADNPDVGVTAHTSQKIPRPPD